MIGKIAGSEQLGVVDRQCQKRRCHSVRDGNVLGKFCKIYIRFDHAITRSGGREMRSATMVVVVVVVVMVAVVVMLCPLFYRRKALGWWLLRLMRNENFQKPHSLKQVEIVYSDWQMSTLQQWLAKRHSKHYLDLCSIVYIYHWHANPDFLVLQIWASDVDTCHSYTCCIHRKSNKTIGWKFILIIDWPNHKIHRNIGTIFLLTAICW